MRSSLLKPSEFDLEGAKQAIRNAPENIVSDAMLRVNHNWLMGERYDAVLAYLLRNDFIFPKAYGVFHINRQKLPVVS